MAELRSVPHATIKICWEGLFGGETVVITNKFGVAHLPRWLLGLEGRLAEAVYINNTLACEYITLRTGDYILPPKADDHPATSKV